MIVSFSNRFIFIKTQKTGGTSAEIVLSTWCSGNDICTPIRPRDEVLRRAAGGQKPTEVVAGKRVYNHMPASQVKALFPDFWHEAFKFTIERHPYEKVVSFAYFNIGRRGTDPNEEFAAELEHVIESRCYIDRGKYLLDGRICLDEIILYDHLWERMKTIGGPLGKSIPDPLPMAKAQFRRDRRPARELLTPAQRIRVQNDARFEFATFGFAT
jgi:hypothetical protein